MTRVEEYLRRPARVKRRPSGAPRWLPV